MLEASRFVFRLEKLGFGRSRNMLLVNIWKTRLYSRIFKNLQVMRQFQYVLDTVETPILKLICLSPFPLEGRAPEDGGQEGGSEQEADAGRTADHRPQDARKSMGRELGR